MKQPKHTREEIISMDIMEAMLMYSPINLDLCGIYFVSAHQHIEEGKVKFKELTRHIDDFNSKQIEFKKLYSDKTVEYVQELYPLIRHLEPYLQPVVQHFSTAKILLVACAETYINEVASTKLEGGELQEFDKLSITGKYLFIQDILILKRKIKLGDKLMQDLNSLIKQRNKLVHFKGKRESIIHGLPNFLEELALTPKECDNNLKAVKNILKDYCNKWLGQSVYSWTDVKSERFRSPCFYLGSREGLSYLYSEKIDKKI